MPRPTRLILAGEGSSSEATEGVATEECRRHAYVLMTMHRLVTAHAV